MNKMVLIPYVEKMDGAPPTNFEGNPVEKEVFNKQIA